MFNQFVWAFHFSEMAEIWSRMEADWIKEMDLSSFPISPLYG